MTFVRSLIILLALAVLAGRPAAAEDAPVRIASQNFNESYILAEVIAQRLEADGMEVERRFGDCVVGSHFPAEGTPTQPVEAGYMANAWLRMRHPDYDELRGILDFVGRTVKVRAR